MSRLVHLLFAALRDRLRAALFLTGLVAAAVADMLAPRPVYAWYWHAAEIGYVGVACALMLGRSQARE